MNRIIANIYKKLLNKGKITEDEVPEEAKELYEQEEEVAAEEEDEVMLGATPECKIGAITIPNMERTVEFTNSCTDSIAADDIFTTELLGDRITPTEVKLKIKRVEANRVVFPGGLGVSSNWDGKLNINARGVIVSKEQNNLFRVDLNITSGNYEDMMVSIYYIKK